MSDDFIFDGFEPANTTAVPDVFFDVLLSELSGAEIKVMLYIIRRTLGFKKTTDAISFNQFLNGITTKDGRVLDKGCGVKDRTTLSKALKRLEKLNCIETAKGETPQHDKDTTAYTIKFVSQGVVGKSYQGSREIILPLVGKTDYPSREIIPGVVGKSYLQDTVLQQTVRQVTEQQEERTDASAIASAVRTPFSQQEEQQAEHIHIAPSEQEARVSEQEDIPPDENNSHSHSEVTQANSVGVVPRVRAKAVPPEEQKTPPKPRRTPPVHKDGVPTPERIEQVFVCMEGTIRRLTEQDDFTFGRTKKAKEAIKDLLQGRVVSQEKMDWHIVRLWHKPKDTKTGFWWRENMSVVAICNNYDREIVNYKPPRKVGGQSVPQQTVSGKPRFEVPDDILEAMTATGGY